MLIDYVNIEWTDRATKLIQFSLWTSRFNSEVKQFTMDGRPGNGATVTILSPLVLNCNERGLEFGINNAIVTLYSYHSCKGYINSTHNILVVSIKGEQFKNIIEIVNKCFL